MRKKELKTKAKNKTTKKIYKKAKPKRDILKALKPQHNPKVRRELLDADYLDKLDDKSLNYYAKFMSEYVGAAISKDKKTGRVKAGHLHRRIDQAKEIYDNNNRRNNDVFGVSRANSLLSQIDVSPEDSMSSEENETKEVTRVYDYNMTERAIVSAIDENVRLNYLKDKNLEDLSEDEMNDLYISKKDFIKMYKNNVSMPSDMTSFYLKFYAITDEDLE